MQIESKDPFIRPHGINNVRSLKVCLFFDSCSIRIMQLGKAFVLARA